MDYLKNKEYKIIWLNSFKKELGNIYYYLSKVLKEPSVADKFHKKIFKIISSLKYLPNRYQKIFYDTEIRRIPIDNYIILYKTNHNTRTSLHFTYFSL